ncbi:MAG TPA: hypothetical protein PL090_05605, partial [Syntrophales bacterium]|nr:hypothetical protein [Syntrophales bacterium]
SREARSNSHEDAVSVIHRLVVAGGDIACPHTLEERAVGEDGGTYPWRTEIRESEGHGRKTPWPFLFLEPFSGYSH